jgi:hypothetical protein
MLALLLRALIDLFSGEATPIVPGGELPIENKSHEQDESDLDCFKNDLHSL